MGASEPTWDNLYLAQRALDAQQALHFKYLNGKGESSERTVIPLRLSQDSRERDSLLAWCESRAGLRHFRLNRMQEASLVEIDSSRLRPLPLPPLCLVEWLEHPLLAIPPGEWPRLSPLGGSADCQHARLSVMGEWSGEELCVLLNTLTDYLAEPLHLHLMREKFPEHGFTLSLQEGRSECEGLEVLLSGSLEEEEEELARLTQLSLHGEADKVSA